MKKMYKCLTLLALFSIFISCKKDDDSASQTVITVEDFVSTIAENPSSDNLILGIIKATTSSGKLLFSLKDQNVDGALNINAATGELSIANIAAFDFETNPSITATSVAIADGTSEIGKITIILTDVDETVLSADDFTITIAENPVDGAPLGSINASTTLGSVSYTITTQTPEGAMTINSSTGELSVADVSLFDFETNPTLIAEIEVVANSASETVVATITLNDVTEAVAGSIPFIFTWEVSAGESIRLPRGGNYTYDYTVDWGDGTVESVDSSTSGSSHVYANGQVYTVKITGKYPWAPFFSSQYRQVFRTVEQWGNIEWGSMASMFFGVTNFGLTATDVPDLSNVTDMSRMFQSAPMGNLDLTGWNTNNVENMESLFRRSTFSGDISTWNTGKVTNMNRIFADARDFNSDLSNWNVGNVTDMSYMFADAQSFNQDISNWNVSKVTNMTVMFSGALVFNQNLNSWNVDNVLEMIAMFRNAKAFNSDLNNWNVSNITNMLDMFAGASNFNGNVSSWDVSNVTDMTAMFSTGGGQSAKGNTSTAKFNQDISGWDVSNVTQMTSMFALNADFNQDISSWNVGNVVGMGAMFSGATSFNQDISGWDISKVLNTVRMFENAVSFNQNLSSWDVEDVTQFNAMFEGASSFNQDLSSWQFPSLQNSFSMQRMFDNSGLSSANYDALLNSFANQASALPNAISFGGTGLTYCNAATSRNTLINTYNWIFSDTVCTP